LRATDFALIPREFRRLVRSLQLYRLQTASRTILGFSASA